MKFRCIAVAVILMTGSAFPTVAGALPKWQATQSINVQLISDKGKGLKQCKSNYTACTRRIPADYQGHPGREANWKTRCKAAQTECLSQYGSAANAHWCNAGRLNSAEKTICKSSKLLSLDTKLNEEYLRVTEDIAVKGRAYERLPLFRKQQRAWIKKRNRCGGDLECLGRVYEARLQEWAP